MDEPGIMKLVGEQVEHFLIGNPLGRGTYGWVMRGKDLRDGRPVALKFLAGTWVTKHKDLFEQVADRCEDLVGLSHPHVMPIKSTHTVSGILIAVMELASRGHVGKLVAQGKPADLMTATISIRQAAAGLEYLHERNLTHGDLKPTNLLVDEEGHVRVADAGLARLVDELGLTNSQLLARPLPYYYSPEQCKGERADYLSDIYSLGACYYHLLTGQVPFPGDSPFQLFRGHTEDPVPDPTQKVGSLPIITAQIIAKTMAKRPEDRYTSVGQLAEDLAFVLSGETVLPQLGEDLEQPQIEVVPEATAPVGVGAQTSPPQEPARPTIAPPPQSRPAPAMPKWAFFAGGGAVLAVMVLAFMIAPLIRGNRPPRPPAPTPPIAGSPVAASPAPSLLPTPTPRPAATSGQFSLRPYIAAGDLPPNIKPLRLPTVVVVEPEIDPILVREKGLPYEWRADDRAWAQQRSSERLTWSLIWTRHKSATDDPGMVMTPRNLVLDKRSPAMILTLSFGLPDLNAAAKRYPVRDDPALARALRMQSQRYLQRYRIVYYYGPKDSDVLVALTVKILPRGGKPRTEVTVEPASLTGTVALLEPMRVLEGGQILPMLVLSEGRLFVVVGNELLAMVDLDPKLQEELKGAGVRVAFKQLQWSKAMVEVGLLAKDTRPQRTRDYAVGVTPARGVQNRFAGPTKHVSVVGKTGSLSCNVDGKIVQVAAKAREGQDEHVDLRFDKLTFDPSQNFAVQITVPVRDKDAPGRWRLSVGHSNADYSALFVPAGEASEGAELCLVLSADRKFPPPPAEASQSKSVALWEIYKIDDRLISLVNGQMETTLRIASEDLYVKNALTVRVSFQADPFVEDDLVFRVDEVSETLQSIPKALHEYLGSR